MHYLVETPNSRQRHPSFDWENFNQQLLAQFESWRLPIGIVWASPVATTFDSEDSNVRVETVFTTEDIEQIQVCVDYLRTKDVQVIFVLNEFKSLFDQDGYTSSVETWELVPDGEASLENKCIYALFEFISEFGYDPITGLPNEKDDVERGMKTAYTVSFSEQVPPWMHDMLTKPNKFRIFCRRYLYGEDMCVADLPNLGTHSVYPYKLEQMYRSNKVRVQELTFLESILSLLLFYRPINVVAACSPLIVNKQGRIERF